MKIRERLQQKLSAFIQLCRRCNCCCPSKAKVEIVHETYEKALAKPTYYNLKSTKKYNKFDDTIDNPVYDAWDTDDITSKKDEKNNLNHLSDTNPFKYNNDDSDDGEDVIYFNQDYFSS